MIKKEKCQFTRKRTQYQGYAISQNGVMVDLNKIKVMTSQPTPTTIKELWWFLGLTCYYKKFIITYGIIVQPFNDLLKTNAFKWNEVVNQAFLKLKDTMAKALTLALPNFSLQFFIECHASGMGIKVVLMQNQWSITYFSTSLQGRNLSLSTYERNWWL